MVGEAADEMFVDDPLAFDVGVGDEIVLAFFANLEARPPFEQNLTG